METADTIPNQADIIQDDSRNAGYYENGPTLDQESNPLDASACAKIHKNKESQILFQPPTDNKAESLLPEMKRNVEAAAFPQEATRYNRVNKRNLNSIAENREGLNLNHGEKTLNEGAVAIAKNGQDRRILKQREKSKKNDGLPKDDKDQLAAKAQKDHVSPKPLPSFEDFFIEEEEGYGGYGTVYRARRRVDGKVFAIKCPHPNAHPHHVNNELKMLERFGGRSCVIKYDSSFRSGDLECFVLEHVKHDRPEILKKEINMLQLQYYGYYLFRALACLHKQGIVHRDVKPGNFLFSRKMMKGYLIDFNLTNDLHQKFLKNFAGHGKQRREGSCVGTKGFRAPEVLSKSCHQGCKVDVWSAGVTLLYFVISRTPFGGDPEQNIKEIANLRGSEELWEAAKLHNCESSYPSDLFDVKSLQSLVDKCLAVNPRCRLTSEDALMHEFFAPVRDSLRKQRVPRSSGSDASCSSQGNSLAVKQL